jgi:hypothetical protein
MKKKVPVFYFGFVLVQRARRGSFGHVPIDIKVTIVAWAYILLDIRMPGYPAA